MTPAEVERAVTARVAELIGQSGEPMPGALEARGPVRAPGPCRWRSARAPTPWSSRPPWTGWASDRTSRSGTRPSGSRWASPTRPAYLSTAAKLGIDPTGCLAVEDSFNGAISARAARMRVVAVPEPDASTRPGGGSATPVLPSLAGFDEALVRSLEGRDGLTGPKFRFGNAGRMPIHEARGAFPGQGDRATLARTGGRPVGPRRSGPSRRGGRTAPGSGCAPSGPRGVGSPSGRRW